MDKILVIDAGTVRTKLLFATLSGERVTFDLHTLENTASTPSTSQPIGRSRSDPLHELTERALDQGFEKVIVTCTDILRHLKTDPLLAHQLSILRESACMLSTADEAALFWEAISLSGNHNTQFIACDIGGGSVQLVWGAEPDTFLTEPAGTLSLQRKYQENGCEHAIQPGSLIYQNMQREISRMFRRSRPPSFAKAEILIIGSNVMSDFFTSAFKEARLPATRSGEDFTASLSDIRSLASCWGGRPYTSLGKYFPANPNFMFGADKLLLIATSIADHLNVDCAAGTNCSVSRGIAYVALKSPEKLGNYDLRYSDLEKLHIGLSRP